MEIKIPEELVTKALEDAAESAIQSMLRGRNVQDALLRAVSDSMASESIARAVTEAAETIDHTAVTNAIALEMQRCVVAGVAKVIEDAVVEIIAKMRGVYRDDEKHRTRAEIQQAKESKR